MNSTLPNPRYERKFTTQTLHVPEVLALVGRHPALFREIYPPRMVNNLYLDSPDLRDYQDHVSGVPHRMKTRIRWYGSWSGAALAATLEWKLKSGLVSGKATQPLPPLSMNGSVSLPGLKAALAAATLPPRRRFALDQQQPSLLNRYHRHYFLSADRRFRLTVDSGLQFAAAPPAATLGAPFHPPTSLVVIELKYDLDAADRAEAITNRLPLRLARCSKYLLGIDSLKA